MRKKIFFLVLNIFLLIVSGCGTWKNYVDPMHADATYEILERIETPRRLKLQVKFQANGREYPKIEEEFRARVERSLRATGFCVPVEKNAVGEINITINESAKTTMEEGVASIYTFGAIGWSIPTYYEMRASLAMDGKLASDGTYKHALHAIYGNKKGPPGVEAKTVADAQGIIVDQLVVKFISDIQKKGI